MVCLRQTVSSSIKDDLDSESVAPVQLDRYCLEFELIDETPVAFVSCGVTLAVMMATPADIVDFAVGFSRTQALACGVIDENQIKIRERARGIECHLSLGVKESVELSNRIRALVSPSACGLCGVRSISHAVPLPPVVPRSNLTLSATMVTASVTQLRELQPLHDRTHGAHAAGFLIPQRGIVCVREDIGRHNALDKLIGALLRMGEDPSAGAIVLTSRVSVEMVQKVAAFGASFLIAVSAPSELGVRIAKVAGITLVTNVRQGHYVVRTHAFRFGDAVAEPTAQNSALSTVSG